MSPPRHRRRIRTLLGPLAPLATTTTARFFSEFSAAAAVVVVSDRFPTPWKERPTHVLLPSSVPTSEPLSIRTRTVRDFASTGRDAHVAIVTGGPKTFRVVASDAFCHLERSTSLARNARCAYAINGGPFESYVSGGCVGLTIVNGTVLGGDHGDGEAVGRRRRKTPATAAAARFGPPSSLRIQSLAAVDDGDGGGWPQYVSFGTTSDGRWIVGTFPSAADAAERLGVSYLVTGFGYLVYNASVAPQTDDPSSRAPRTAMGVDKSGRLLLFQSDGCEKCFVFGSSSRSRGATTAEVAKYMSITLNATYAISLDGGGSSTSVGKDGTSINRPTCLDYVDFECERPVANVVCVVRNDGGGGGS